MNTTSSKYEAFICNTDDVTIAHMIMKRLYNYLNSDLSSCKKAEYDVNVIGTFDNNYMFLTSEKAPIAEVDIEVAKQLVKVYYDILEPFVPGVKIIFKSKSFNKRK